MPDDVTGMHGVLHYHVRTRPEPVNVLPADQRTEIRAFVFGTNLGSSRFLSLPHIASAPPLQGEVDGRTGHRFLWPVNAGGRQSTTTDRLSYLGGVFGGSTDRKSTRLNSSHLGIS